MRISRHTSCESRTDQFFRHFRAAWILALSAGLAPLANADLIIPAGALVSVGGGTIDLSCTDLVVAGTLQVGTGSIVNIRNVSIQGGGVIDGGSGALALGGDWANGGAFIAGSGAVRFRDLCSLTAATITGSTTFSTASFVSALGKTYRFGVGSTQTVQSALEIAGTVAQPIQLRSTSPGQVASVNLLPGGTQPMQHVGVTDVWAVGQWLAASLTNEGGGGNANRWFGGAAMAEAPIPTLAHGVLAALIVLLAALGGVALRRRERSATHASLGSRR